MATSPSSSSSTTQGPVLPLHLPLTRREVERRNSTDLETNKGEEQVCEVEKEHVLGIPLHKMSRPLKFAVCVGGVMVFYLLYGYTQVCPCNQEI